MCITRTAYSNFVHMLDLFKPCCMCISWLVKNTLYVYYKTCLNQVACAFAVVTLSPPTSEAGVRFPARPQVGKLVVACRWSAVYSTEP